MVKEFEKLTIEQQVDFINNELLKDKNISVTKLCNYFGIKKNTLISRFNKAGYKYNTNKRIYIKIKKNNIDEKIIDEVAATVEKNIEDDIKELVENKTDILNLIRQYKNNINEISDKKDNEMIIDTSIVSDQVQNHNFKVYKNVVKEIQELQKEYKYFKLTDLVSSALHEYYVKYKKK